MFKRIKNLYKLLTKEQRRRLIKLQLLVVVMAFAEVAGVLAIGPFMALVGDISHLEGTGILAQVYQFSGIDSYRDFLFWVGILVLLFLTVAAAISIYTIWRLSVYAQQIGAEMSSRLYRHYIHQSWLFHASGSSSKLTNQIVQESGRITNQIIQPLMLMNAKIVMAIVMASVIFIFNPIVALAGLMLFGTSYVLLYRTVRLKLSQNGNKITQANRLRFKLMNEGFGGIKDTLLLGRQADFNKRFENASRTYGRAQGVTKGLSQAPRYAMELIAFAAVIFLVLYLLRIYDGNLGTILPVLSVYALAGFKLLPAFQQIYTSVAQVRGNLAAFDSIEADLLASKDQDELQPQAITDRLSPKESIELENVVFRYPGKEEKALNGLSIKLPANKVIGLVGASGSGKSTAIDVLLGLIEPTEGFLKVDAEKLTPKTKRAWQNNVGFVPQSIFLADASIRENIAFGLPEESINDEQVKSAAKMAHLDELLSNLPEGLDTRVGERGVQLSGGQRQRIGIARALYDDAEVLVLDEATSALDGITEKLVMDAINDFAGKKTIVMIAHRLSTVKSCDTIYLLEDGKVLGEGTYDELFLNNEKFKKMAMNA
ncbi:multidrug ABC transporter ATP-binding protein [Aliidiomarina minuta]|uniref:Multidrug ABC transporter ATP-binding protein n=2 Tax=Aliidiomarina minuta TaxID=880057 RepID=A0A432W828_9GAMM|nr:multidrug ABC transporter ATP-binding protein [Aliidiomarina minuta]